MLNVREIEKIQVKVSVWFGQHGIFEYPCGEFNPFLSFLNFVFEEKNNFFGTVEESES